MVKTLEWGLDGTLRLLDQRNLPFETGYVECQSYRQVADCIKTMVVRGAPAIGITAAYGMVLAAAEAVQDDFYDAPDGDTGSVCARVEEQLAAAAETLKAARPTAVNLAWAVDRMLSKYRTKRQQVSEWGELLRCLEEEAQLIHEEDVLVNRQLGILGAELVTPGDRILTHCNAGALATGGYGTALGVIRRAWEVTGDVHVLVDETRPRFQGARLTSWELLQEEIPHTVITDNSAGWLMRRQELDIVFVGADRVAANGDVANKIGTYSLAVLAHENDIPFYVVVPSSTVDLALPSGEEIPIEKRSPAEVTEPLGSRVVPEGTQALNYAFDVTPNRFVTGIITEAGIAHKPYTVTLQKLLG
jgi:methylthioribose-1-phosphate isomerase